jgi:dTDP-6-deoxy-L-talose 4-dehydrogenase (NAD+)
MILVTGGNGFVGTHLVRSLQSRRLPLRIVLREGSAFTGDLGEADELVETPDLFSADPDWWANALKDIETVVHLAWYAEPGKYLLSNKNIDCLTGTINLALACIDAGVRRFVGIGTCAEYDLSQGILRVDSPLNPQTLYASCKASAFQILRELLPSAGIEFAWCRLFYLYGEGEDPRRLVPYIRKRLSSKQPAELTSGRQIRDFLDVKDAADMIADVALSSHKGPINVCSGVPITVRQLAEQVADEFGRRDLLRFGALPDNRFDPPCVLGMTNGDFQLDSD